MASIDYKKLRKKIS